MPVGKRIWVLQETAELQNVDHIPDSINPHQLSQFNWRWSSIDSVALGYASDLFRRSNSWLWRFLVSSTIFINLIWIRFEMKLTNCSDVRTRAEVPKSIRWDYRICSSRLSATLTSIGSHGKEPAERVLGQSYTVRKHRKSGAWVSCYSLDWK
jgi:hypothetical protein